MPTTITVSEDTLEQLDDYKFAPDQSREDILEMMMTIVPSVVQVEDGCDVCGDTPIGDGPIHERYGGVHWFTHEHHGGETIITGFFCSRSCAHELEEKVRHRLPENPDLVRIGGHEAPIVKIAHEVEFRLEGDGQKSLMIGLPCLEAHLEEESTWFGEPVYIKHQGEWVQHGVITRMEGDGEATYMDIGVNFHVSMPNHPDDAKREEWEEVRAEAESSPGCDA